VLVLDMIEILPPLGKHKYDTWRMLPVKCYIDNYVRLWSCIRNVNKCGGDKEMEESIFICEELQGFDGDEDEPLHPSTSSPKLVPTSILEAEAPHATTSSIVAVEVSRVEEKIISEQGAPSHIQKGQTSSLLVGRGLLGNTSLPP
jgi:hypothetical protein